MKKNITIEGLWNLGKTAVSKSLLHEDYFNKYKIDEEPILESSVEISPADKNKWYMEKHADRVKNKKDGFIFDRSLISCAAYLYAQGLKEDYIKVSELIKENFSFFDNAIIAFLSIDEQKYVDLITPNIKDLSIKQLVANKDWLIRYQTFYREVLPFDFGITPFEVPVMVENIGESTSGIVKNIINMINNDRRCQVNVVPIKNGEILVLQRNERKGGFWQTITGGIQVEGTFSENILREIEEELNIIPNSNKLKPAKYTFGYMGGEGYFLREYVFYYTLDNNEEIKLSDEHVSYNFLSPKQAIERVRWDGNKEAILRVSELLKK